MDMNYENISNGLDAILNDDDFSLDTAFESSYMVGGFMGEDDIAEEGLFFKPKSTEKLLKSVESRAKKLKTAEDCDDLLAKLKTESKKFNECLKGMKKAAEEFRDGAIDKKELSAKIKPFSTELKNSCSILTLGKVVDNKNNVTDEEIKKVKDFIEGATKIISERRKELNSASATESYGYNADCGYIAEESFAGICSFLDEQFAIASEGTAFEGIDFYDVAVESTEAYSGIGVGAESSILGFVDSQWKAATEGTEYEGMDIDDCEDMIATEEFNFTLGYGNRAAFRVMKSEMRKDASNKVKEARKKFKVAKKAKDVKGIKDAISTLNEAKKLYEAMKKKINKMAPDMVTNRQTKGTTVKNISPYVQEQMQWCETQKYNCDLLIDKYEEVIEKIKKVQAKAASESFGLSDFLDDLDIATEGTIDEGFSLDDDEAFDDMYEDLLD